MLNQEIEMFYLIKIILEKKIKNQVQTDFLAKCARLMCAKLINSLLI